MEEMIHQFLEYITNFVEGNNLYLSVFFGVFAIVLESIVPILPLALFIAINIIAFGNVIGFLISWISTVIGCSISFFICREFKTFIGKKMKDKYQILEFMNKLDTIRFSNLFLILAMPFTPAFSVNIAAGLSNMKYHKYLLALLLSKIFIVYFWGYVGSTFLENITDISLLLKLCGIVGILFLLSKLVTKKFNL